MPNLPDRTERENALAAALILLFRSFRADVEKGAADWYGFASSMAATLRSSLAATYAAAANALATTHTGAEPVGADDRGAGYATTAAAILAADIANNTRAGLLLAVERGGDVSPLFSDARAESIAVTETTRAISEGEAFAAAVIASVTRSLVTWFWQSEEDDSVCAVCDGLNGQEQPATEPPAHPMCRCEKRWSFSPLGGLSLAGGLV